MLKSVNFEFECRLRIVINTDKQQEMNQSFLFFKIKNRKKKWK